MEHKCIKGTGKNLSRPALGLCFRHKKTKDNDSSPIRACHNTCLEFGFVLCPCTDVNFCSKINTCNSFRLHTLRNSQIEPSLPTDWAWGQEQRVQDDLEGRSLARLDWLSHLLHSGIWRKANCVGGGA